MFLPALILSLAAPEVPSPHGGDAAMTCPVGGERFSAWQATMYSTYGERPDGKPYSYLPFPLPLAECPSNHLVIFADFSAAEIAALTTIIETPEYKGLIAGETSHYRAYWLATKLGRPALGWLIAAIWQVSPGDMAAPATPESTERLVRYQELLLDRVRQLPPETTPDDRVWLEARAANAARQLGRFDEAEALRLRALASLQNMPEARGWAAYLAKLAIVIARHDDSVEPLDMIPDQQVPFVCAFREPAHPFGRAICARADVAAEVAQIHARAPR